MNASANGLNVTENAEGRPVPTPDDRSPEPERVERQVQPLGDPAVVAVDIGKRFGDRDVVEGLNFEVQRGNIFGIIGTSG